MEAHSARSPLSIRLYPRPNRRCRREILFLPGELKSQILLHQPTKSFCRQSPHPAPLPQDLPQQQQHQPPPRALPEHRPRSTYLAPTTTTVYLLLFLLHSRHRASASNNTRRNHHAPNSELLAREHRELALPLSLSQLHLGLHLALCGPRQRLGLRPDRVPSRGVRAVLQH